MTRRRQRVPVGRTDPLPPRPDHGAVEIEPWTHDRAAYWRRSWEDETGPLWRASWRDQDRLLESPPCSRQRAVEWAYHVPAAWRLIRRGPHDGWVELPQP